MPNAALPCQAEVLPTPAEMGAADGRALGLGVSGLTLMRNAGRAVAREAVRFGACRTLVLCGPGNNGGDGWVAARLLALLGWPVAVAAWGVPRPGSDAWVVRGEWRGPVVAFAAGEVARAGLVIDAVFGAGLRDAVPEEVSGVLAGALAKGGRVLAVDVPSGLDGATGQARGAVRGVERTVTFVARKPGHLLLPGRALCGKVVVADIGMPAGALRGVQTWRNTPGLWRVPVLGMASHKYTRGHVTVLGGGEMTGGGAAGGGCGAAGWGRAGDDRGGERGAGGGGCVSGGGGGGDRF